MFPRRYRVLGLTLLAQDLIITLAAFVIAYVVRDKLLPSAFSGLGHIYPLREYWPLLVGTLGTWAVLGSLLGLYRNVDPRSRTRLLGDAVKLSLLGSLLLFTGFYLLKASYISRSFVLLFAVFDSVLLLAGRWYVLRAHAWYRRVGQFRYFLILGTGPTAQELAAFIEESEALGNRLIGFIRPVPSAHAAESIRGYPVYSSDSLREILSRYVVDEVLFAVAAEELSELERLITLCRQEGVRVRLHLGFLPYNVTRVYLENLQEVPLLTLANSPDDELLLFCKRLCDFALAAVALVALSPLLLAVAVAVRLSSAGPVLYRQTRCGLGGRKFTLLKFRSMVAQADQLRPQLESSNEAEHPLFKIADDPRCTPLGRWLRKFSLDELPQLWNILRGDMSFVGPRPPLPHEVAQYKPQQRRRLRMRPGLTCLWALEGRSQIGFDRWIELDLAYIDNWSLWLDCKILLKTIPIVLAGRGAY